MEDLMRFLATLLACAALCAAVPAQAAEKQKCPLEVGACLEAFAKMKTRPWLGITYRHDSTGTFTVVEVMPGSPAERGGLQSGDVLLQLNGAAITEQARLIAGSRPSATSSSPA
jgi:predicted metalloprotease with PDZ domain